MQNDGSLKRLGELAALGAGREMDYVVQSHAAKRAGLHNDLRIGDPQTGLISWAVPKARMPEKPGESLLAIRQPLHRHSYGSFEGTIPEGRGAGTVKLADTGRVAITESEPGRVRFALLHQRYPQEFQLSRKNDKTWFLTNVTPSSSDAARYGKEKYGRLGDVDEALVPGTTVSPKIDGASVLMRLLANRAEVSSVRERKGGGDIRHTWKIGGMSGLSVPERLQGTVLRGELYGKRGDRVISASELSGLLNTDTITSRRKQREKGVRLLVALHGLADSGKLERPETREKLRRIFREVEALTGGAAHAIKEADTPESAKALVEEVRSKRHPLTTEGVVAFKPGERPAKKVFEENADVYIRKIYPADVSSGVARAGGFEYSLTPTGPIVGRVGSGFSREDAVDMLENPEEWIDRKARIKAHSQFDSGAWRAPAFETRHDG